MTVGALSGLGLTLGDFFRMREAHADQKSYEFLPAKAESVIDIMSVQNSKVIVALSGIGRVREYQLQYRVQYQLITPKGKVILPPANLLLARDMTYNDAQVLAKGAEEQLLYRDMQKDAAQQIMQRIASAK